MIKDATMLQGMGQDETQLWRNYGGQVFDSIQ